MWRARNAAARPAASAGGPGLAAPPPRMCGIVGIAHADPGRPVSVAVIRRMCGTIRRRGLDDEGADVEGPVRLGMRRLSIIDLAGWRQAIFNEDRFNGIVLYGESYK